jgi:hypothetical protein
MKLLLSVGGRLLKPHRYRHITLSMLAAAFLAVTARTEQFHDQKGAPPAQTSS